LSGLADGVGAAAGVGVGAGEEVAEGVSLLEVALLSLDEAGLPESPVDSLVAVEGLALP
jgi:hypothetical protein